MSFVKKKILLEANKNLEHRFLKNKFLLNEENYIELANQKLKKNEINIDLNQYINNDDILCIPKTSNSEDEKILKDIATWLDNNMDNKSLIEIKLNEIVRLYKTANATQQNTSLSEQSGSDSILFGSTTVSKEKISELGNDIIFLLVMSLVYNKTENDITRKFCIS